MPLESEVRTKLKIAVLVIMVCISTLSTNLYIPALPKMTHFFHASDAALQQTLISFTYGFALCMIFSGLLADYWGRRKTLLMGLIVYAAASLGILMAHNVFELTVLRFFQGLGGCCGTVVARVMVRDEFDDQAAVSLLALLSGGMAVAFMIAPILGSFLLNYFSWKACFLFMFLLSATLFFSIFYLFDRNEPCLVHKSALLSKALLQYGIALRSRSFLTHTFAISITWTGFFLMVMEYPFILITQQHYSTTYFGFIFSIVLCGYFLGTRMARYFSTKNITPDQSVLFGLVIMCLSCLPVLLDKSGDGLVPLISSGFIYLTGLGIQMPNSQFAAIPADQKSSAVITSLLYFIEMFFVAFLSGFFKSHVRVDAVTLWFDLGVVMTLLLMGYILYCRKQYSMTTFWR